jgi:hypothetical protein
LKRQSAGSGIVSRHGYFLKFLELINRCHALGVFLLPDLKVVYQSFEGFGLHMHCRAGLAFTV